MSVATYATLTGLYNLGNQLNNDCDVLASYYGSMLTQMQTNMRIQDPATPEDPTARIWHPNMLVIFNEAQLAQLLDLYNHVAASKAFWDDFLITDANVTTTMFDVTPQLDALVADIDDIVA